MQEGQGVEKIKTTGFRYIVGCGIPDSLPNHAQRALNVSSHICLSKSHFRLQCDSNIYFLHLKKPS